MNTPCLRPLLAVFGLLLAAGFGALTGHAQGSGPAFVSPNRVPVFPSDRESAGHAGPLGRHELALLFNATQLAPGTEPLDEKIAGAFGLAGETAVLPLGPAPIGLAIRKPEHFFAVSRISERKEFVIFHELEDGSIEAFLCDFSGRLRDAAVVEPDGSVRKVGVWRAARKFMTELSVVKSEARANSRRYIDYVLAGS